MNARKAQKDTTTANSQSQWQSGNQAIRQSGNQAIRQSGNQAIIHIF
jgi:hypothetical protein